MARTIKTKVYKFEELSEQAKAVAIEWYKKDDEVHLDFFNDDVKEQIEKAGFYDDVELQYSLSYSQGDGLSFSCNKVEESLLLSFFAEILGKNKEKTAKIIIDNCSFENTGNKGSNYCYASTNDISFELENYGTNYNKDNIDAIVSQVEKKLQRLYFDLCKDFENQGYKDIEYQRSDEAVTESIIANEYEFTINGNRF
jgi:hypothetical protein